MILNDIHKPDPHQNPLWGSGEDQVCEYHILLLLPAMLPKHRQRLLIAGDVADH